MGLQIASWWFRCDMSLYLAACDLMLLIVLPFFVVVGILLIFFFSFINQRLK